MCHCVAGLWWFRLLLAASVEFVYGAIAFGAMGSLWLSRVVLAADDGTSEMRAVSDPIREGATGFLNVFGAYNYGILGNCTWKQLM